MSTKGFPLRLAGLRLAGRCERGKRRRRALKLQSPITWRLVRRGPTQPHPARVCTPDQPLPEPQRSAQSHLRKHNYNRPAPPMHMLHRTRRLCANCRTPWSEVQTWVIPTCRQPEGPPIPAGERRSRVAERCLITARRANSGDRSLPGLEHTLWDWGAGLGKTLL
jgi:hypothetical protein